LEVAQFDAAGIRRSPGRLELRGGLGSGINGSSKKRAVTFDDVGWGRRQAADKP
jgi:hypothetical protein